MPGEQDNQGTALDSRKKRKERIVVMKLSQSTINTSEYILIFFIHEAYKNAGFMLMENI